MSKRVRNLREDGLFADSTWYKRRVLLHVASISVMPSVSVLPWKIWHQKNGVKDKTERVVEQVGREQ